MEKIIKHFDKTISLGYNCFIKRFLNENGIEQETHFFDWIGSSMWSVNELIRNNFSDLFDLDDYVNMKISNDKDGQYVYTNKKYYLRFLHDLKQDDREWPSNTNITHKFTMDFHKMKISYARRAIRFQEILNTPQNTLFIRYEEPRNGRIIYDKYKKKFISTELEEIIIFSKLLKQKYSNTKCTIIFISKNYENNYDSDNNIIVLSDTVNIIEWEDSATKLKSLFNKNIDFILDAIDKNSK